MEISGDTLIKNVLRDIFRINLGVKKYERVLLFNDKVSEKEDLDESDIERRSRLGSLSLLAAEIGKNYCKSITCHEYFATGSHGAEPPEELWKLAFGKKAVETLKKELLLRPILKKNVRNRDIKRAKDVIRRYKNNAVDCVIALSNYIYKPYEVQRLLDKDLRL